MMQQAQSVPVSATAPVARLDRVTVSFENRDSGSATTILENFSLECGEGEFVVIVGASGCGKTTVLNLLAGLIDPQAGEVQVMGKRPRAARQHLGYMFARDALVPSRTAMGNVEIGLEVRGVGRAERRERAQALMNTLGLAGAESRYPWQLSQGMRQRVALARTWALDPKLVLMDEPFAALDAQTRESARAQFLGVWERTRSSVIFVTHDLTEALLLGDRVVIMGPRGRIIEDFKPPFGRPRDAAELPLDGEFRALEVKLRASLNCGHAQ
jgi:NitT/TauT family transport system ATP-binding protein